jgi:hypothetical protein
MNDFQEKGISKQNFVLENTFGKLVTQKKSLQQGA